MRFSFVINFFFLPIFMESSGLACQFLEGCGFLNLSVFSFDSISFCLFSYNWNYKSRLIEKQIEESITIRRTKFHLYLDGVYNLKILLHVNTKKEITLLYIINMIKFKKYSNHTHSSQNNLKKLKSYLFKSRFVALRK